MLNMLGQMQRTSDKWNILPTEIRRATNVNIFMARAKRFFMEL